MNDNALYFVIAMAAFCILFNAYISWFDNRDKKRKPKSKEVI